MEEDDILRERNTLIQEEKMARGVVSNACLYRRLKHN